MLEWNIEETVKFSTTYKRYEKKHEEEAIVAMVNLINYMQLLEKGVNPLQISASYVHDERKGLIAVDQKTPKRKLKETRLYFYPDLKTSIVYLLIIGDKNTQQKDIKHCRDQIKKIRSDHE
ncbi:MAG: hypothetical protein P9L88_06825 [Candidatus Tantalella remota]|nr:hypothetical protein [Candidatus Tantalella remota]